MENSYLADLQFAGLVEAATAAAGHEQAQAVLQSSTNTLPDGLPTDYTLDETADTVTERPEKRRRIDHEEQTGQLGQLLTSPQEQEEAFEPLDTETPDDENSLADEHDPARILFRKTGPTKKQYSRPVMSKLYSSLGLTPENFLHLQSSAKAYMLDENYPERQSCVGHRGGNESNQLIRLKLKNCTQDFLTAEGLGEKYWGSSQANSSGNENFGSLIWPRDTQKIVKICIPLLRRQLTNEKQRKYSAAVGNRNTASPRTMARSELDPASTGVNPFEADSPFSGDYEDINGTTFNEPGPNPFDTDAVGMNTEGATAATEPGEEKSYEPVYTRPSLLLHINVLIDNVRIVPRLTVTAAKVASLESLRCLVRPHCRDVRPSVGSGLREPRIRLLLAQGLTDIRTDSQWHHALSTISLTEWMDNEVRVLLEIERPRSIE